MEKFNKLFISLRYYLIGRAKVDKSFVPAIELLEFSKDIHVGKRKNGDPEFQHQLEIAHLMRTLEGNLRNPALVLATVFGHDLLEDYSNKAPFVTYEEVQAIAGSEVADELMIISKEYKGVKKSNEEYYAGLILTPHGSIAKGGDRVHNHSTMTAAFSHAKQLSYVQETEDFVLPMMKEARRKFFDQEAAYENIKFILQSQMTFVRAYLKNVDQQ